MSRARKSYDWRLDPDGRGVIITGAVIAMLLFAQSVDWSTRVRLVRASVPRQVQSPHDARTDEKLQNRAAVRPAARPAEIVTESRDIERDALELVGWAVERGIEVEITSIRRTFEEQAELYRNRLSNPWPVAPPGTSNHEFGRAFDLSASPKDLRALGEEWERRGGRWGGRFRQPDPVHFER